MKTLSKSATRQLLLAIPTITPLPAVISCKGEMDCCEKLYVTLSSSFTDNTIPFKQDGDKQELTIEANRRFSITFDEGAEWVSATSTKTIEETHQIVIMALPNRSEDAREAQMIIKTSTTQHVYLIMQLGSTGRRITYTSLTEVIELGEGLDQNGKTIDQDLHIRATVMTHAEAKQLPFAGYHHIQGAKGSMLVLIVPKGKGKGALQSGDEITAKLKGAKISNYEGTIQLQVSHIQMSIAPNKPVEPIETMLAEIIIGKHLNQYAHVKDVQFVKLDVPFFDSASAPSTHHKLVDKSGNEAELDVWGTATFGEEKVPSGSGSITAVVAAYKSNKANKTFSNLRPTLRSDIKLDQPRFDVGGGNQSNPNPNPNPQGNVYGIDLSQTACTIPFADDFSKGGEDKKGFTLPGWLNKALVGTTLEFQNGSYGGVHLALANALKSTEPENRFVLVTPHLQVKAGSGHAVDLTYSASRTSGATLTIQQLGKDGKLMKTLEVINNQSSPNGFGNQHYKKSYTIAGSADVGYIALLYEALQKPLHTTTYQVEALTVK